MYKRPRTPLLVTVLGNILNSGQNIIIVSILNAKHPNRNRKKTNTAGRALLKYINSTSPTRFQTQLNQSPDVLEITIIKAGLPWISTRKSHYRVFIWPLTCPAWYTPLLCTCVSKISIFRNDMQICEVDMESRPFIILPLSTEDQLNSAIQLITELISDNVKSNSVTHNPSDRKTRTTTDYPIANYQKMQTLVLC